MDPLETGETLVPPPVDEVAAPAAEDHAAGTNFVEIADTKSQTLELDKDGDKIYPSLYDSIPTTFGAILIGAGIIGGIQWMVRKIFATEKRDHKALTQFVTAMFALIVGVWIADKIIAGPTANIIDPAESKELLTFIKDITLMVFSYYFGTKANVPSDDAPGGE